MCRPIQEQAFQSQPNLIKKLGGESEMGFLLMNFCDSISEDADLQMVFGHMSMSRLSAIMSSLIKSALESNFVVDGDARLRVIMKNYAVFELGINTKQFKKLKSHFETALQGSWIEESILEECTQRFAALRIIFEEEGKDFERTAMATRVLAAQLVV
ncbi:unnamed protein product [Cylindrotheca closterium]|uniref:Uncharacterized protein n=1 Tax=Cylindrotheca closterium TaxID=2856 RepID=A0AAD2FYY9_9STRA|nr:unnamed protein product [Cylindrotheca closterium]CAJ1957030.1 unnamed protein product [Cylindrotheca closterium]CAJ1957038.1 unnamed protein product [Cylindrotheca closterium]